jgi:hypothetical protein
MPRWSWVDERASVLLCLVYLVTPMGSLANSWLAFWNLHRATNPVKDTLISALKCGRYEWIGQSLHPKPLQLTPSTSSSCACISKRSICYVKTWCMAFVCSLIFFPVINCKQVHIQNFQRASRIESLSFAPNEAMHEFSTDSVFPHRTMAETHKHVHTPHTSIACLAPARSIASFQTVWKILRSHSWGFCFSGKRSHAGALRIVGRCGHVWARIIRYGTWWRLGTFDYNFMDAFPWEKSEFDLPCLALQSRGLFATQIFYDEKDALHALMFLSTPCMQARMRTKAVEFHVNKLKIPVDANTALAYVQATEIPECLGVESYQPIVEHNVPPAYLSKQRPEEVCTFVRLMVASVSYVCFRVIWVKSASGIGCICIYSNILNLCDQKEAERDSERERERESERDANSGLE